MSTAAVKGSSNGFDVSAPIGTEIIQLTRKQMLDKVHGGRHSHLGARRTWMTLNQHFPGHGISYAQVAEHLACCLGCQKARLGMNEVLVPIVRHLKNPAPRRTVGCDHLSLDEDKYHMTGVYVVRDHFSKMVFIHPVKVPSSTNAATALFLYSVYYGCFDYLNTDPGSDFTSQVVSELNAWFGIHHRVSLTDRHESNGVEGANKEILRHITVFLNEFRVKDRWSEPNIIAWCMFIMNKFNDAESGIAPYTLTFGSESVRHFDFPKGSVDHATASNFLRILDDDLALAKKQALELQAKLLDKRLKPNEVPQNCFQPGDFVLRRYPKDKPLPSKLVGKYEGPFEVLIQRKNDVSCRHCVSGHVKEFFVADLKLFVGTKAEAELMAQLDADQHVVDRFLAYKGDPMSRMSMEFQVRFADNTVVWLPWSEDLFATVQYEDYVRSVPEIFPLLHRVKDAKLMIAEINKVPISGIAAGDTVFIDIRAFGADWYGTLSLPDLHTKTYLAQHTFGKLDRSHLKIDLSCELLRRKFSANPVFVHQYCRRNAVTDDAIVISADLVMSHPDLVTKSKKILTRSGSDYEFLVGKRYIDDEDSQSYEVVKVRTLRDRSIVADVKLIREPYSKSKLMSAPVHIADIQRMYEATVLADASKTIPEKARGRG
jgi:hypothetical protein